MDVDFYEILFIIRWYTPNNNHLGSASQLAIFELPTMKYNTRERLNTAVKLKSTFYYILFDYATGLFDSPVSKYWSFKKNRSCLRQKMNLPTSSLLFIWRELKTSFKYKHYFAIFFSTTWISKIDWKCNYNMKKEFSKHFYQFFFPIQILIIRSNAPTHSTSFNT